MCTFMDIFISMPGGFPVNQQFRWEVFQIGFKGRIGKETREAPGSRLRVSLTDAANRQGYTDLAGLFL